MVQFQQVRRATSRAWIWAGLWGLLVLILTSIPGEVFAEVPTFGVTDLTVHTLMYLPFAALVFRAIVLGEPRVGSARAVVYTAAICVGFAALDELHQYPIPGRGAEIYDWLADCVGIGLGIALGILLTARTRRRSQQLGENEQQDG
ncbi:MAG: VanZ family protein [Planctomycetes bacterium]|nr:VanZ family protein [Planctomycetota bacterium]